jgi:hypothetical protein
MIQDYQLSDRHARRLVELSRDSYRYPPLPNQLTRDLCARIVDIADVRRRFGYRRIHDYYAVSSRMRTTSGCTGFTETPTWQCVGARRPNGH